jgi:hypothetical protein
VQRDRAREQRRRDGGLGRAMIGIGTLRRLCAAHRNPIGIPMTLKVGPVGRKDHALPDDENDRDLLEVRDLLDGVAGDAAIVWHLAEVEQYMGLTHPSGSKERFVAEARRTWAGLD